jgi:bacterioferritin
MQGDEKVLELLNKALTIELTAVNQYFLHARIYDNWGLKALGQHEYKESIEEMQHADKLIRRILFLNGLPNMQVFGKLQIGTDVPECIQGDLTLEKAGRNHYIEAITYCESVRDYVSRDILKDILSETEGHLDYLETQLDLIGKLGLQNYLQSAMGPIEG